MKKNCKNKYNYFITEADGVKGIEIVLKNLGIKFFLKKLQLTMV